MLKLQTIVHALLTVWPNDGNQPRSFIAPRGWRIVIRRLLDVFAEEKRELHLENFYP